ncbi:hypothetical protein MNBD_GAMMA18-1206 [hydrothermal vent metagenome]|uniref:Uncharacterized protein n=1 Tax=hydrothermal vent metagenome TaxID=652676 RepID=A0A3B0Z2M7_9ZZZZ
MNRSLLSRQCLLVGVLAFLIILLLSATTLASEGLPSRLTVDFGFDESGAQSRTLDMDYALTPKLRLALSASEYENSDYRSELHYIALASDPLAPVQLVLGYERWDSDGEFRVDTLNLLIGFNTEQWSLSINPIRRDIAINFINPRRSIKEVTFTATGLTISLGYFMVNGFQLGLRYSEYDYSENVARLDPQRSPSIIRFISPIALSQAQGLDDHNYYLDLGYPFEWLFLNMTLGQSQSAVDGSDSDLLVINSYIPLTDDWELAVGAGRQTLEGNAITFSNLGLSLYW